MSDMAMISVHIFKKSEQNAHDKLHDMYCMYCILMREKRNFCTTCITSHCKSELMDALADNRCNFPCKIIPFEYIFSTAKRQTSSRNTVKKCDLFCIA